MTQFVYRHGRCIEVETLNTATAIKKQQPDPFVKVPLRWAAKAAKATKTGKAMVWLELLYAAWQAKSNVITLSNKRLEQRGVNRFAKYRALRELEADGMIAIERQGKKAPVVTILI
jgi:hypothetical protein